MVGEDEEERGERIPKDECISVKESKSRSKSREYRT